MSHSRDVPQPLILKLKLRLLGESVELNAEAPQGQMRLDEALPLLRQIDDLAIDRAIEKSNDAGRRISCCRGCDACCRAQPVPVTPAEAYALWLLVEDLAEPRRSEIRAAFASRSRRLFDAGLADAYLDRDPNLSQDDARHIARRYFSLRLACPFLAEEGACGIYDERPFVCRQYLVTSPPELCLNPFENPVNVLPVPLAAATAFQAVSTEHLGREQFTIPLVLALEYVERHRNELERKFDSQSLITDCIQAMFEAE
jgi:Fe-S-cluster containining protein